MAMSLATRSAKVWLFYLKHQQGQKGGISVNIIREMCQYLADPMLVQVTSTFLCFFTSHRSLCVPLQFKLITAVLGLCWRMDACSAVGRD